MPKAPTAKQIKTEIALLKALKPKVPQRNYFGESNWQKIDAAIETLEESFDEEAIDSFTQFEDGSGGDDAKWTMEVASAARDACQWAAGEETDPPSKGWKPLTNPRRLN